MEQTSTEAGCDLENSQHGAGLTVDGDKFKISLIA